VAYPERSWLPGKHRQHGSGTRPDIGCQAALVVAP